MARKPRSEAKQYERDLTPKQEAFALAYFETGSAAEAYRRAYDVDENAKDQWLYVEASQLLDHPKVALRISELRQQADKMAIYTRQKAMDEYEKALQVAERAENGSAMVSAINGRVKLWGLEAPTRAKVEHTGKDGGPIQTIDATKLSTDALRELMGAMNETPEAERGCATVSRAIMTLGQIG